MQFIGSSHSSPLCQSSRPGPTKFLMEVDPFAAIRSGPGPSSCSHRRPPPQLTRWGIRPLSILSIFIGIRSWKGPYTGARFPQHYTSIRSPLLSGPTGPSPAELLLLQRSQEVTSEGKLQSWRPFKKKHRTGREEGDGVGGHPSSLPGTWHILGDLCRPGGPPVSLELRTEPGRVGWINKTQMKWSNY